jgi:hypothetical protein
LPSCPVGVAAVKQDPAREKKIFPPSLLPTIPEYHHLTERSS